MLRSSPLAPAVSYLRVVLAARLARMRAEDRELGASVVEWVVIMTIVVVLAVTIGVVITKLINTDATKTEGCISTPSGCTPQ